MNGISSLLLLWFTTILIGNQAYRPSSQDINESPPSKSARHLMSNGGNLIAENNGFSLYRTGFFQTPSNMTINHKPSAVYYNGKYWLVVEKANSLEQIERTLIPYNETTQQAGTPIAVGSTGYYKALQGKTLTGGDLLLASIDEASNNTILFNRYNATDQTQSTSFSFTLNAPERLSDLTIVPNRDDSGYTLIVITKDLFSKSNAFGIPFSSDNSPLTLPFRLNSGPSMNYSNLVSPMGVSLPQDHLFATWTKPLLDNIAYSLGRYVNQTNGQPLTPPFVIQRNDSMLPNVSFEMVTSVSDFPDGSIIVAIDTEKPASNQYQAWAKIYNKNTSLEESFPISNKTNTTYPQGLALGGNILLFGFCQDGQLYIKAIDRDQNIVLPYMRVGNETCQNEVSTMTRHTANTFSIINRRSSDNVVLYMYRFVPTSNPLAPPVSDDDDKSAFKEWWDGFNKVQKGLLIAAYALAGIIICSCPCISWHCYKKRRFRIVTENIVK